MATETVTVLFTDLVGSTELLSRVGEARADELRREHFGLLRKVIEETGGREVKNLGDGLMVVFDGVASALDAAVAMQQAITARPEGTEPLSIKLGVAVGDAELEDGDYFGLPVVEAARLCAKAEGGEILTTEFVRMLARSRSKVELDPIGALELKGLDEPVETFRVRWSPVDRSEARPPLPSRLASVVSGNFVGRVAEREQLAVAWKAVTTEGEQRVMLLSGEPGIGKTTLSARCACDIYESGAAVVYGRCDEDLGIPYQPWIEALSQLVRHVPEAVLAEHVADRGAHLARLVPELSRRVSVEPPAGGDADSERFVLFGCVVDLLARASSDLPVLVVLDDLHWADRGSVQLLRHVATCDEPMRVAMLGTFRDSDITTEHPLTDFLAALHREDRGLRIPLPGFSDEDVLQLLETVAGHEMDEQGVALRNALLAETAGNPFFVAEILRHLAETGAIYQQADGRWVADADLRAVGLPVSVREVVGRRLAGLGPDTERVLGLGAVIGRDFDISLLAAVAHTDEDTLIDLCDAAVEAAVLQPTDDPDRYTFAHALIEHTLYEGLSPARRARAHKTVAEHLEIITGGGTRVGELAYHWAQAVQPTDTAKAVHYAQVAGERALDQLAPDDALRWYSQALDLIERGTDPDSRKHVEILVGLGIAQRQTGDPTYRETLLDAARLADRHDHSDLLARAALANNRGFFSSTGDGDQERIAIIDRALERLDPTATSDRARLLALATVERTFTSPLPDRRALAEESVAEGRVTGEPDALAFALCLASYGITHPSTLALRTAWLDEACDIVEGLDDPALQYSAHRSALLAALERADGDALDRHAGGIREVATRAPDATIEFGSKYHRAWQAGLRGDLSEYERLSEVALNFGLQSGQPDAFALYGSQLMNARWHQGRLHEMVPLVEQAVIDQPGIPTFRSVLAFAKAYAGDHDGARGLLADAAADSFGMPEDTTWSTAVASWTGTAVLTGSVEVAPALRQMLTPYHDQLVTFGAGFQPALAHYLGQLDHLLGAPETAEQWFAEAVELHERVRSPVLVAQTHAAWAALLADRSQGDDRTRAREMAERAHAAATAGGYGYIERDARAVLERLS